MTLFPMYIDQKLDMGVLWKKIAKKCLKFVFSIQKQIKLRENHKIFKKYLKIDMIGKNLPVPKKNRKNAFFNRFYSFVGQN